MTLSPLLTAGLETVLNHVLYRDRALKAARQRLNGRSLSLELEGMSSPLVIVFSERQLDLLADWGDQADCLVRTRLSTLLKLHDRQQFTSLIRSGELEVEGDLQVVQQFSALIDLAEKDPAEYLSPWTGDIAAYGMGSMLKKTLQRIRHTAHREQRYLSEAITEEWRLAPGALEGAWLNEEVDAVARHAADLQARLDKLEAK